MQNNNGLRGLLALVGVALALPLPAQETLEEIVVTARKREESLQEIPLTITVFDADALDRLHITDLKSIADYTPGLTFDQGFVQQDTRPQIRGLPATRGRPPVGVLIDGIDVSSESMVTAGGSMLANLQLVDAERIEVVKGPQSALYGRVAFGGAVNYVTKQPGEEMEGYATVDVGDYGQLELKGAIGGPVTENFGLRLNVAHASHDGFYTNTASGQEIGGTETTGLSLAGKFTPSDRLDIRGRIMYSESEWEPRAQTALIRATEQSAIVPLDVISTNVMMAIRISGMGSPPSESANTSLGLGQGTVVEVHQEKAEVRLDLIGSGNADAGLDLHRARYCPTTSAVNWRTSVKRRLELDNQ